MKPCTRIALLIAGGVGTRLWPASTATKPKQFLHISPRGSLLHQAWSRSVAAETDAQLVVTGEAYADMVASHLADLGPDAIVAEPSPKNTAPALALAAGVIKRRFGDASVLVLPADHSIPDEKAFGQAAYRAMSFAESNDLLCTFGVVPTRPETGYGYIKKGALLEDEVFVADSFREKPDTQQALEFLQSGNYLWNSGMFVWRNEVFLQTLRRHAPDLHELSMLVVRGGDWKEKWNQLEPISVDYALMEKADNVAVMPVTFAWDDMGSWLSMRDHGEKDGDGNAHLAAAPVAVSESRNNIIFSDGLPMVLLGVEDTVVAASSDGVLVAAAEHLDKLKQAVQQLQGDSGLAEVASTVEAPPLRWTFGQKMGDEGIEVVEKPWGREVLWAVTAGYCGKILEVKEGETLSLQYHEEKQETMLFLEGRGVVRLGEEDLGAYPGLIVNLEPGTVHRVTAKTNLILVEVSTTELDDVIRLEDRYGRI